MITRDYYSSVKNCVKPYPSKGFLFNVQQKQVTNIHSPELLTQLEDAGHARRYGLKNCLSVWMLTLLWILYSDQSWCGRQENHT